MEFYCVKCKCRRLVTNIIPIITKNGKHAFQGNCCKCKTVLIRFAKTTEILNN